MARKQALQTIERISQYMVKTVTRIIYAVEYQDGQDPASPSFMQLWQDTAAKASTAKGLRSLIKYCKKVSEQFFETAPESKSAPTYRINGLYNKSLVNNQIRLLSIKLNAAPNDKILVTKEDVSQEVATEIRDAVERITRQTAHNTTIRYSALEFYNLDQEAFLKAISATPEASNANLRFSLQVSKDYTHNSCIQQNYYKENLQVINCTMPILILTCEN